MQILRLATLNPDELLSANAFGAGAVIHVQSATTKTGVYADITNAKTTLLTKTYEYTVYDQAGVLTTWYQRRYENVGGTVTGAYSAPFQAQPLGYVDRNEVKLRLKIDDTDTTDDAILDTFIVQASEFVDNQTGRQFYRNPNDGTNGTFLFDGWDIRDGGPVAENGRCLLVPRGIVSMTQLRVATFTGAALTVMPSTDWFLRSTAQETETGWPFTELWITNIPSSTNTTPAFFPGFATTEITGILGWPAVPTTIADIVANLVVTKFRKRAAGGPETFSVGADGQRTVAWSLNDTDWRSLKHFRITMPAIV